MTIANGSRIRNLALGFCFAIFIGISIETEGSLTGGIFPSEQNRMQLSQYNPNMFKFGQTVPSNKVLSRYRFQGSSGKPIGLSHRDFLSRSQQTFFNSGQTNSLVNQPYPSTPLGYMDRSWSKYYPQVSKTLRPRSKLVQPSSYSYFSPRTQPRNYNKKTRVQYQAVNNFPGNTRFRPRYESFISSVSSFPVSPFNTRYSVKSYRNRIMYPTDRVERDSVLNMRSGKVIPWTQQQTALSRNLHLEQPLYQKPAPRWPLSQNYKNPGALYLLKAGTQKTTRHPGTNIGNWHQSQNSYAPKRPFQDLTNSALPNPKEFTPRPQTSANLRSLPYVLKSLKKRNARFTTARGRYTTKTETKGAHNSLYKTKQKRFSRCSECALNA